MEIIQARHKVRVEKYGAYYEWNDSPGAGFSFDCDEAGDVYTLDNEAARENYEACVSGEFDVTYIGVVDYSYDYWEPTIGRCDCGHELNLDHFTNACKCGRDYNSSGTLLAPREQWGEETGEHPADISRIP